MRVVIALGGNALLRRGEPPEVDVQRANVRTAARAIAEVAGEQEVVVTHGNGPQVGLLALQAEAFQDVKSYPLDVLGAESEGMIGYLLEQELDNALPGRNVATLLTQVEVDAGDPAFENPTKPIGPLYEEADAKSLARTRGWSVAREDAHYRRVVPSPLPRRILEMSTIRLLVEAGHLVICGGGGGIPVAIASDGTIHGVEAVIDKDRSAALLAAEIEADGLLLLTDQVGVHESWPPTPDTRVIRSGAPHAFRGMVLDPGSMGPKVEAACWFVERTGGVSAIGRLEDAGDIVAGRAGTRVERGAGDFRYYD